MGDPRAPLLRLAFVAGCAALFVGLWLSYRSFFFDDAFITFRYARNLAGGLGPVFNAGEAVEGYTTFLWMLVCSVPFWLFESSVAVGVIKFLGLLLGLGVLWRAYSFPGPDGVPRRRYAVVLLAASPVFVVNCGDGLETPLFALLLLEFARAVLQARTFRGGAIAGGLLAALVLTRPEALPLVIAAPAALMLGLGRVRGFAAWGRGFALAAAVPIGAHLCWRFLYYGTLVPNTYYAKATGSLPVRLESGVADVGAFMVGTGSALPLEMWLALLLAGLGTLAALRAWSPDGRAWHLVLWLGIASRVAFDVWSGSEWMGVFRFLAPSLPLLVVLADEGRRELVTSPTRGLAVGCALGLAVVAGVYGHDGRARRLANYRVGLERAHVELGRWLQDRYAPETWVAIGDCGAVPFYSGLPTIDLWGLVDAEVSALPGEYGHRPGTAGYALGRKPGVIVIFTPVPIEERPADFAVRGVSDFDSAILAHPQFQSEYRFVREFTFRPNVAGLLGYYLAVFERS